jgi:hypothetical protein
MTAPACLTEVQREARLKLWPTDASSATDAIVDWSAAGLTVRAVRGSKMRLTSALMNEVAAALQFPHYFGENWAALDECLADMEWLMPSKAIVVVIREAEQVLADESVEQLAAFVARCATRQTSTASPSRSARSGIARPSHFMSCSK